MDGCAFAARARKPSHGRPHRQTRKPRRAERARRASTALTHAHPRARAQVSAAWTAALRQRCRNPSGALGLPSLEPDPAPLPASAALPRIACAPAADGPLRRRGGGDGDGACVAAAMAIARLLNPAPPDIGPG